MKKYVVTGIGTDIGKTVAAAILTEALEADYWKPVQAGNLEYTDTDRVRNLISNSRTVFHPEAYRLKLAASPHQAAAAENITIDLARINIPPTPRPLVIEGAGGLMVPLNNQSLIIDLIAELNCPVILVSKNYLGSINHTLLSVEALRSRNIPLAGIIFNGEPNPASEDYILKYTGLLAFPAILPKANLSRAVIKKYADQFKPYLL